MNIENEQTDNYVCKFCGRVCKSKNSHTQHEIRCKENPNRSTECGKILTDYVKNMVKGKTSLTCESIAKQRNTMLLKYANGYMSPLHGRKVDITYIYESHNNDEIRKWLDFVSTLNITIPHYETRDHNAGYKIVAKHQKRCGNTIKLCFEHKYLANILLDDDLQDSNAVHHIDLNRANNDIHNLMVFNTKREHTIFHNCSNAYLQYNEYTHKFSCIQL